MARKIADVLTECNISEAAKYDWIPQQLLQILMGKLYRPYQTVHAD